MNIIEGISHPLINALGWTLLHALWQLMIIALLWRLAMYLARKASASLRYNLSLISMLTIPVVFAFTFYRQYQIFSHAARIVSLEFDQARYLTSGGGNAFYLVERNYPGMLQHFDSYTPYLFWFYIGGIVLFSIYSAANYSRLYALRRNSIQPLPESWQRAMKNLRNRVGIKRIIPIYQTPKISVPAVVGFFKPMILLPLAMLASLSPSQVEAILLHELYHIRRHDHILNMLQNLLEILFFFHPATWWISQSMRRERENCVDEWVVMNTANPMIYAQALVSLEEKRTATLQPVVAATQSRNFLLSRIKNIMTMKTRSFNPGQRVAALLIILTAVVSVAWFNPAMTINHGHPSPDHYLDASPTAWPGGTRNNEAIAQTPPPQNAPQPPANPPRQVHMHNGKAVSWEELSEEDRQKLREAMEEMRINLREVNKEIAEKFNSEEFRQQMQQAVDESRRAMLEVQEHFNSEEFHQEMQAAQEEVRKAMLEVQEHFRSEEFRHEMKGVQEEIKKAMKEVHEHFNSEEFKQEMQGVQEEVRKAMLEVHEHFRSEEFKQEMQQVQEEVRKAMQEVQEHFRSEEFKQEMKESQEEINKAIQEMMESIEEKEEIQSQDTLMMPHNTEG